ncbi:hypothetical protein LFS05_003305 [Vibrio parahaemolyticus]|nr:hypothetical protein [Vibrio parahaemolyticus]
MLETLNIKKACFAQAFFRTEVFISSCLFIVVMPFTWVVIAMHASVSFFVFIIPVFRRAIVGFDGNIVTA